MYVAVCPAFTVAEVEPPAATPMEKSSGAFIVSVSAADVLTAKLASPPYLAVIEWVPTDSDEVLKVACALAPNMPVAIWVVPSENVTMPVGVPVVELETVAVNVTDCPKVARFAEDISAVELAACWMV